MKNLKNDRHKIFINISARNPTKLLEDPKCLNRCFKDKFSFFDYFYQRLEVRIGYKGLVYMASIFRHLRIGI